MTKSNVSDYRADIDGLRAIAVLIVVAFHAGIPGFSGGYVGVDVFFVISGFLITGHLYKELDSTSTISFVNFYAKRFKRLYPAIFFLLIICILVWGVFFLGAPPDTKSFVRSIRYSIFGLANVFFKNRTGGYFDSSSEEMPLLHFWSLAVEEQFYLIWPMLLILSSKIVVKSKSLKFKVILILSTISVLSYLLTEYLLIKNLQKDAFYYMPARAWELGVGGLLFFIGHRTIPKVSEYKSEVLSIFGIGLIVLSTIAFDSTTRFPGSMALIPVLATALIIYCGCRLLKNRVLVELGVLSYGWYLWHWPFFAFLRIHFMGELPPLGWRILAIMLSLFMAKISLDFVEKPLRSGKWISGINPKIVCLGAVFISGVLAFVSKGLNSIEKKLIPESWEKIVKLVEQKTNAQMGCYGSPKNDKEKNCVINHTTQDTKKFPELIVWGDSHAQAMFPMFEQFAAEEKLKVSLYAEDSLLPLIDVPNIYLKSQVLKDLEPKNLRILKNLPKNKNYSVILVSRWPAYVGEKPISVRDNKMFLNPEGSYSKSLELYQNGLIHTLTQLNLRKARKILIVQAIPEFKFHVLKCSKPERCMSLRSKIVQHGEKVNKIMKEVVSRFQNVKILDPLSVFCDELHCSQIIQDENNNNIPVVLDDDHISIIAAKYLGRRKAEELRWLISP